MKRLLARSGAARRTPRTHADPSISTLRVVWPFVLVVALLVVAACAGLQLLSASRAYAAGGSRWAVACSTALVHLRTHARSHATADYHAFLEALEVPTGDRAAREEMLTSDPDPVLIADGFRRGGIHDDDIAAMRVLFALRDHVAGMPELAAAWADGDRGVADLLALGQRQRSGALRAEEFETAAAAIESVLTNAELRFAEANGTTSRWLWHGLSIACLAAGAVLLALTIRAGRQVAARHAAEQRRLQADRKRWLLAADAAKIGVFDWEIERDRLILDEKAVVLCHLPWKQGGRYARADIASVLVDEDRPAARASIEAAVRQDRPWHQRYRVRGADGSATELEVIGVFTGDDRDEPRRLVGIVRDISNESANAQLQIRAAAAQQAAQARTEFLSRLSHELRTPLNAVLGFSQLLEVDESEPLGPTQTRRVRAIAESGAHLLKLVEDVLDLSKIDNGVVSIDMAPVDLAELVGGCLTVIEAAGLQPKARLINELGGEPRLVMADPVRLRQVLVNLLSNACKYNRAGGLVRVVCARRGDFHALSVCDEGRGLNPDEIEALFVPFKRLPADRHVPGTGLGLVIAKRLLERMGGRIEIASRPGAGTTFTVLLPHHDAALAWHDDGTPTDFNAFV